MNLGIVLACAGKGIRFKRAEDKAFVKINGMPMYCWSLDLFSRISSVSEIAVVADEKHHSLINRYKSKKHVLTVKGGKRRQDSVYKGVLALGKDIDTVIIHDGARPVLNRSVVDRLIRTLKDNPAVICGLPVKEALKKEKCGFVKETIKREHLWSIQTPQGFDRELLMKAYNRFKTRIVYDEAQLMELMGIKTKLIKGDPFNIKITYPDDLKLAELFLKNDKHR